MSVVISSMSLGLYAGQYRITLYERTEMSTDTPNFWNDMWLDIEDCGSGSDEILVDHVGNLKPRRALEIGCGTGGNAIWLSRQGWLVTAVDFSSVAVEKGMQAAAEQGAEVKFVVADASTYVPHGRYDLITSFYIQLFPEQRAAMLNTMSEALAPGGTLLFVSHDKSGSPSGWSEEDLLSLTTPEEIVAELSGLQIDIAQVLSHAAAGTLVGHMHNEGSEHGADDSRGSNTTIVRATRPR